MYYVMNIHPRVFKHSLNFLRENHALHKFFYCLLQTRKYSFGMAISSSFDIFFMVFIFSFLLQRR